MDTRQEVTRETVTSLEFFCLAMFIVRRGDRKNRRRDAIEALESALEQWPDNQLAVRALRRIHALA